MTTLEQIKADIKNQLFVGRILNSKDFDDGLKWCLDLIDKYAEQEPTDEWQNGYDMAWEEAEVFYEQEQCDDVVSRQAVLKTLNDMDNVLDEDRTIENYIELLKECYEVLPSVRPQEPKERSDKE